LNYRIDDSGVYFKVYVFQYFVVKVPKHKRFKDLKALQYIAEAQTYLSQHVEGVLPCYLMGKWLVMPTAPGKRGDAFSDNKWECIKQKRDEIVSQIREHGYTLGDVGKKNVFYDEREDKVYIIDFHPVKKQIKRR